MTSVVLRIAVALAALALGGCTNQIESEQSDPAGSVPTTMRPPRHIDKSDRPEVSFDPCLDLPDAALIEAGYDPTSKQNADFTPDSYTFLGCSFDTLQRRYGLNVLSGNISFDEEREKTQSYATPTEINGRRALLEWESQKRDECAVSVETPDGVLIVSRLILKDTPGPSPQAEWCAGLEDTARIIEPFIPKGD